MAMTANQREKLLRQLQLQDNPPPDADLQIEEGVPASPTAPQGQLGENAASPVVQAAVKKDKVKRNRRRSKIITNFQDQDADGPDERKRRRA